jgi:hypothetical protein
VSRRRTTRTVIDFALEELLISYRKDLARTEEAETAGGGKDRRQLTLSLSGA